MNNPESGGDQAANFTPELHERVLVEVGEEIGCRAVRGFLKPRPDRKASLAIEVKENGRGAEDHPTIPGVHNVVRGNEVVPQLVYPVQDPEDRIYRLAVTDPPSVASDGEMPSSL